MPQLTETKQDTRQTYFSESDSLECFYSVYLKKYCLQFNGVYFFYTTLKSYKLNRDSYIKKYNLTLNN